MDTRYWLNAPIYNFKINDYENSDVLIIDLYGQFFSNCKCCSNDNFNNKCFYCFSNFLKLKTNENRELYELIYEIDDMEDFREEIYKYTVLEFEIKQIYEMGMSNNILVFCKKISESDKNKINTFINESLNIFLNGEF